MNSIDRRLARLKSKLRIETPIEYEPESPVQIYFVECGDWIKIGRAQNTYVRFADLDNAIPYPIRFLGSFTAQPGREIELHHQFKNLRHKGEWFRKEAELLELIDRLCIRTELEQSAEKTGRPQFEQNKSQQFQHDSA